MPPWALRGCLGMASRIPHAAVICPVSPFPVSCGTQLVTNHVLLRCTALPARSSPRESGKKLTALQRSPAGGVLRPRNDIGAPDGVGRARFFGQMQVARQRVVGANRVLKDVSPCQGSFGVNVSYPGLREYAYPGLKNAAPLGLRNRVPENRVTCPMSVPLRVCSFQFPPLPCCFVFRASYFVLARIVGTLRP